MTKLKTGAPIKIGFDLDGPAVDYVNMVRAAAIDMGYDPSRLIEPTQYSFRDDWGITSDEFESINDRIVQLGFFATAVPETGFVEAATAAKSYGMEVHIDTARWVRKWPAIASQTIEWLDKFGIPYDFLHFNPIKTLVRYDLAIEDHLVHAREMRSIGSNVILLSRPWNRNAKEGERWRRIDHTFEFSSHIDTLKTRLDHVY